MSHMALWNVTCVYRTACCTHTQYYLHELCTVKTKESIMILSTYPKVSNSVDLKSQINLVVWEIYEFLSSNYTGVIN